MTGSSPRVRGTEIGSDGKALHFPVHPRACGERVEGMVRAWRHYGSSPRVRGTACYVLKALTYHRFIPARAGNGCPRLLPGAPRSVHPRACGERTPPLTSALTVVGSSPRVRGTARGSMLASSPCRFIPARAGNGRQARNCRRLRTVHPRACGERPSLLVDMGALDGSSPRVRGTARIYHAVRRLQRFIPARAGNGLVTIVVPSSPSVHPRACGERERQENKFKVDDGSSPRVRGTAKLLVPLGTGIRFIPARAGNGQLANFLCPCRTVHPRACGERRSGCLPRGMNSGSSPCVRGTDG